MMELITLDSFSRLLLISANIAGRLFPKPTNRFALEAMVFAKCFNICEQSQSYFGLSGRGAESQVDESDEEMVV